MSNVKNWIKAPGTVIIDVRTREEFMGGHVTGSENIPLNELDTRVDELKKHSQIILCCASGMRSGRATAYLQQMGITCENGGSWLDVNYLVNNN
jgi:rhodanese-related sulfurtransferase